MTNFERYRNEIIKISKDSENDCLDFVIPNVLEPMDFDCDDISCDTCHRLFSVWLLNEYKEPEEPEVELNEYKELEEPIVDWSKVPVDTKIYVKENIYDDWTRRHFARYEKGEIYAWYFGRTSWSASGDEATSWKYAKLAEDEEV